jgi:NDP-sugar pyrophosphorylase family protein
MQNDFEVLVLCGGEGKRLRSMVSNVPKPMAPIGEKPFLDYLIRSISKQGFRHFCLLSGYKSEKISSYFNENLKYLNVRFSIEERPLGTGGAIFQAMKTSKFNKFLVYNGDTFFNIDLNNFLHGWKPDTLKIALKRISNSARYGQVCINERNCVTSFIEKGATHESTESLINGGIYILDKSLLSLSNGEGLFISLENDIFPLLLAQQEIYTQSFTDDFIDIGIPEDYIRAKALIETWANKPR